MPERYTIVAHGDQWMVVERSRRYDSVRGYFDTLDAAQARIEELRAAVRKGRGPFYVNPLIIEELK